MLVSFGESLEVSKRLLEGASRTVFTQTIPTPHRDDAFRKKWVREIGSGGPAWSKGSDTAVSPRIRERDVLFDVYEVTAMIWFMLLQLTFVVGTTGALGKPRALIRWQHC